MSKKRKHVPLFHQFAETECGLCCCIMLLRYYKSNESYIEIQEELNIGRDGMSMKQMKNLFELRNFDTIFIKTDHIEEMDAIYFPMIAYVDDNHFVVIEKIKSNHVIFNDPAKGRCSSSLSEFRTRLSGVAMIVRPKESYVPIRKKQKNPWLYVLGSLKERKGLIGLVFLLMVGIYYLMLRIPVWIQKIVDNVVMSHSQGSIYKFFAISLIAMLFYAMLALYRCNRMIVLNVSIGEKLEAGTFYKLLRLPYAFFESRSSGDLFQRISSATSVREMLSNQLISGILDIGSIVVMAVYMLRNSVVLSMIAFMIWGVNISVLLCLRPKITKCMDDEVSVRAKSQALQMETLFSINAVKVSAMEKEIYGRWKDIYHEIMERFKKRVWISNLSGVLSSTIQLFGPLFVLLIGILEQISGRMTIGEVIAFYSIVGSFFSYSNSIIGLWQQVIMMNTYMQRLNEIWLKKDIDLESGRTDFTLSGAIRLNNIMFQYSKNSPPALHNISIQIEAGMKVALVGVSGSGKSTLSKILLGLYRPVHGEIYYDNMEVSTLNRETLSKQIGIVPQDSMLFNKSIYENIKMNMEKTLEEVQEVAKRACIHDEIMQMPMGYHTIISEMGINLSGGQRQRILLARALLIEPRILVLDEATSSLDNINEKRIMDYLKGKGCTRIVIAHRLSTIIDSDVIYMLKDGSVIAFGKHNELMENCEEYRALYKSGT